MQTHATHSHSGSVATLPVRTASYRKKKHLTRNTRDISTKQHTLILRTKESIFATEESHFVYLRLCKPAPAALFTQQNDNMFVGTQMIKQFDARLSYSLHSSTDWTPIGHEATLSSHTPSQPPLTMATTSHDHLLWPANHHHKSERL